MFSSRVCIITTNKEGYSETFIRNHIQYLPFPKKALYKGLSPILYDWETEKPLYNPSFYKAKKYLISKWGSFSEEKFVRDYLSDYLNQNKIQIVLAEFGPVGANVVEACRTAKVPLVVHFHGDDAHGERFISKYNGYQKLVKHAKAVVCVSNVMKEQLIKLGFSDQQLHLIPYGINNSFFSGGNPTASAPNFLAVGRFVDKKAPHLTILAFKKVLEKVPDAKLTMIGEGPLLSACKSLIKALKINAQVEFKGICDSDEVQKYMRSSRAFVQHSITPETGEKEGTPLSILEACATGLPIISTYHAGIPEAVIHDKTGFLVDEHDIEGMANYMIELAKNSKLAQKMGEEGRKHIAQHYELKNQIKKLATLLEENSK
ncbi:glycosyltransferase [Catalinimonas niigatensis]|uniref:glycosyltransferase n=1 Tax=Catalinimonas niigatensis TaxID=1397264 RepID=UPI002666309C|nr:glycosyltransferase [Catalinimonas niigatensis]WPP53317.1 glycosyltransferase [Catalinimonas niigatensis]